MNGLRWMSPAPAEAAAPALVRAALPRSAFRWTIKRDEVYPRLFLNVDDESPETVRLHIEVDTHHVPPAAAEALLRTMEEVAVETAIGGVAPA